MSKPSSTPPIEGSSGRRHGRLLLGASILLSMTAVVIVTGAVIDSVTREPVLGSRPALGGPREQGIGLCLTAVVSDGTGHEGLSDTIKTAVAANPHFFPGQTTRVDAASPSPDITLATVAAWPYGASDGEVAEWRESQDRKRCPGRPDGWSIRVTQALLADGADRLLAGADFSEEWTASMEVELRPAESSIRTVLSFSGPLNISGSCWVDDLVSVDPTSGTTVVSSEADDDAGLPGLIACRRFADSLPDGAAGEQALALIPTMVAIEGAPDLRLVTDSIDLSTEAIVIEGSFAPVSTTEPATG